MIALTDKSNSLFFLILILCLAVGCQQQPSTDGDGHGHGHDHPHDHHDRPESLTAAIGELEHIRDEVKNAIEGGLPDDADGPLHEVYELLEILPEIAADTDLPRDKWEEAKAETEELLDAFGMVDKAFHVADGDKKAAYEKVASDIDAAITNLEALLPLAGEKTAGSDRESGHDHDEEHDHEEEHNHEEGHDHDEHDHDQ